MSNSKQKIMRIIDELIALCYKIHCKNFNINVELLQGKEHILLKAYAEDIDEETLNNMKKLLNLPRIHEMEEYYWGLPGNDLSINELNLVGMMIDSASVDYDKVTKLLEIKLTRLE